jgi:hypothetical protein
VREQQYAAKTSSVDQVQNQDEQLKHVPANTPAGPTTDRKAQPKPSTNAKAQPKPTTDTKAQPRPSPIIDLGEVRLSPVDPSMEYAYQLTGDTGSPIYMGELRTGSPIYMGELRTGSPIYIWVG